MGLPEEKNIILQLEVDLGIPKGFLWDLRNEGDWSFIVKLHAFLEAAVTHLLTQSLGKPLLNEVLARLEMSNSRTGKIAFLEKLELLENEERKFIRQLSKLRNTLVHDIRNVSFSFDAYLKSLDQNQKKEFISAISFSLKDKIEINELVVSRDRFSEENPKISILLGADACLNSIYFRKEINSLKEANQRFIKANPGGIFLGLKASSE